jgi:NAD+ synthase
VSASQLDVQVDLVEQILVRFLRSEAGKFGFSRCLLGLSGGIDSALAAALCVRAFGAQQVLGVMMPYRTSDPASEGDARTVAAAFQLATRMVDISAMADGYLAQERIEPRMRRGNVLSRCRMIVLYDLSVEWGGLVIGTSNKTEALLGYSTQFGDAASALNPLGDLYKHQVRQLARHMGLPAAVIDKPPSADLFAGQTDEQELGFTYEEADRLLYLLVDERYDVDQLVEAGFERDFVLKIVQRVAANHYKRLPPIIAKLSSRSINHDFRYLRSWGR